MSTLKDLKEFTERNPEFLLVTKMNIMLMFHIKDISNINGKIDKDPTQIPSNRYICIERNKLATETKYHDNRIYIDNQTFIDFCVEYYPKRKGKDKLTEIQERFDKLEESIRKLKEVINNV